MLDIHKAAPTLSGPQKTSVTEIFCDTRYHTLHDQLDDDIRLSVGATVLSAESQHVSVLLPCYVPRSTVGAH